MTPRPTETRATILAVARRLFAERGYEGVSVRDITGAAGMSTGALFTYWTGKDALFAECVGRPFIPDSVGAVFLDALTRIAVGEGVYGAQAHEYKEIAKSALSALTGAS